MDKRSFTYKFSAIVLGVLAALAAESCMPRGTDEASTYAAYGDLSNVSYSTLSAAVLTPKCVSCHQEFGTPEGLATVFTPGDPDHSSLYQMVASGKMPKNAAPLPATLVQMVRTYIEKAGGVQNSGSTIDLKNVNFSVLSSAVFAPRCVKCHDEFATEDGVLGDVEPGDPDHSILYNFVASGKMPKNGNHLSSNNVAAIGAYIEKLPPKSYPPIAATWTSINANLIQRSCIQCHSDGGSAEKVPFDSYAGVISYDSNILEKIQDTKRPMPPRHTTLPPSPELIKAFSDWMDAGEPQN